MSENAENGFQRPPLTPEEIDLLATPLSDIENRVFAASFDLEKFLEKINFPSPSLQLVQTHVLLDHILKTMLTDAFKRPEEAQIDQMKFIPKLNVLSALGLIPKDLKIALSKINNLRNSVAHKIDFDLNEKNFIDLRNNMPEFSRKIKIAGPYLVPDPLPFNFVLAIIMIQLEATRQVAKLERLDNVQNLSHIFGT